MADQHHAMRQLLSPRMYTNQQYSLWKRVHGHKLPKMETASV